MQPAEIRRCILDEHMRLRGMLDEIEPMADQFEKGDEAVGTALRDAALALYEVFASHLSHEEATLEPALRAAGPEGQQLADRLSHEHREQRALLTYLVSRLQDSANPTLLVAREVRHFVDYVRLDMAHEEGTLLTQAVLPDEES